MAGRFITFEGPEGAGKSTQIRLLAERLAQDGVPVVVTREPGGTAIGERIRSVLLDRSSTGMRPETETFLLTAARVQHIHEVILPALARGEVVLCDRFVASTIAYQGAGRGLPLAWLEAVQALAVGSLAPDHRLLFDLDVEAGLGRRAGDTGTSNRLDDEHLAFHQRVRAGYLEQVRIDPAGWSVIDASQSVEEVAANVLNVVQNIRSASGRDRS